MTTTLALPPLEGGVTLRALGVDNLGALRMDHPIELRKLMLLVGRNGVGKSRFSRVFALLRQSVGSRKREPLMWWQRDDVDFGSFDQALRRGAEQMSFTFGFQDANSGEWTAKSVLTRGPDGSRVGRVVIEDRGHRLSLSFDEQGQLEAARGWVDGDEVKGLDQAPFTEVHAEAGELFAIPKDTSKTTLRRSIRQVGSERESERDPLTALFRIQSFSRLHEAALAVDELARRTAYLGPFRAAPERAYRPQGVAVDQLDPRGGNLAMFLAALSAEEREDLNADLRAKFGFGVSVESAGGYYSLQIELQDHKHNLMDVGYGYSQMLPVAVQLWASSRMLSTQRGHTNHAVLVVEEPEIHLHPHQQVRMARALGAFAAADHGPIQIIETHSDHLVGEIGMLIARGRLPRERVGVLCFEPHDEAGTTVRMATFDGDGVLQNWPVGFLSP